MWTENFDTSPCRFQCSRILSDGDFPHLHLAFLNLLGHFGKYLEENVKLAEGHLSDGLARKTKGKMLTLYELGRRRVRSGPMITNGQTQVLHHLSEIFKFNLEKKIGKFHTSQRTSYSLSKAHRWFHISLPENSTIINFLPRRVSMAAAKLQYTQRLITFFSVKTWLDK